MSQWPAIGAALLGLLGVGIYGITHDAYYIEHDMLARAHREVTAAGTAIPDGGLTVDGRDVTLKGPKGSAIVSPATQDLVGNVWGVRTPVHVIETEPVALPAPAAAPPLPAEAKKLEVDLTQFLDGKTIRFNVNSDRIHPDGRAVLDEVFRILATAPTAAVDITGHTDGDGDSGKNLDLSKRRAAAVKKYLVSKGIKAERLETEGYGSTKPVVPNDTPENKARNRRIEFHASARIPGAAVKNQ